MTSVLIVGSGVAGTQVARQLLGTGNNNQIIMFEAGPDYENGKYRRWLDHWMSEANETDQFFDDPREENMRSGLRGSRLFVKGGTTNHWDGWSLRFKPEDFELKSRTGWGIDWPISYEQLAPYYTRAEGLLGIAGDSDDDDPPRYGDQFPFQAAPYTRNDMPLIDAFDKLGISYSHMPMARNADRCITTGTCMYCPVNARYTATLDLGDLQDEYGDKLHLLTDTPVISIVLRDKTEAVGVHYMDMKTGETYLMEGDAVVVCGGTVESTKLLLASTSKHWPDGVGNDSGHVGQHLVGHPLIYAEGIRAGNPHKVQQELGFITLASRHFDTPEYQKNGKMLLARVGDGGTIRLAREFLTGSARSEVDEKMRSGLHFNIHASVEQFESPEYRIELGAGTDRHGLQTTKIGFGVNAITDKAMDTYTENLLDILQAAGCRKDEIIFERLIPNGAHGTSTCRMSTSDADGVVDENLRVHGTDNVYVCSNAVYPNVTAVNPTLTLGALAVRLGEHLDRI